MKSIVESEIIAENCLDEANGQVFKIPDFDLFDELISDDLYNMEPCVDDLIEWDYETYDYLKNENDIEPVNEIPI